MEYVSRAAIGGRLNPRGTAIVNNSCSNKQETHLSMGLLFGYGCSANVRCALRTAFTFFILFFTEGFVKYARFLNSFKTPERSYFFLNRFNARSIGSFSDTIMPTKDNHLLECFCVCF